MLTEIKYLASWTSVKLSKRLGQRGAEMVEYAIVLACVVAVGVAIYGTKADTNNGGNTLNGILKKMWTTIGTQANKGTAS